MWLHVAMTTADYDGVTNHLLFARPDSGKYAVALSIKEPLPFNKHEWFKALVQMECRPAKNENNEEAFVCNADKMITGGRKYYRAK